VQNYRTDETRKQWNEKEKHPLTSFIVMKSSQTTPRLVMVWEHLRLLNERAGSCSLLETPTGDQGDASRHDVLDATNTIWEILDLGFHPKIHKVVDLHIHWPLQFINVGTYRHGDLIPRSIGRGIDHTWRSLGSMKRHSPCNKHHSDPIPKSMVDKLFIIFFINFVRMCAIGYQPNIP
jgi:hypothetical protein